MHAERTTPCVRVGVRGGSALIGQSLALRIGVDPRFEAVYVGAATPSDQVFDVIVHDATIDDPGRRLEPAPHGARLVVVGGARPGPHAGVEAWLPATTDPAALADLLSEVVAATGAYGMASQRGGTDDALSGLSAREREVAGLLAADVNDREVAALLGVSMPTVRSHVGRIMKKLDVAGRTDLRAALISLGLADHVGSTGGYEGPGIAPRAVLRAFVISPRRLVRDAVEAALAGQRWLVTAASDGPVDVSDGDLVVLTSDQAGIALCRRLRESVPGIRILMVGERLDPAEVGSSIKAGADGYISADASPDSLVTAALRVAMGDASIPQGMLRRLLRDLTDRRAREDEAIMRFCGLTARERSFVALVSQGRSYDEIATELVLSPHTVRTHMQNILRKLGVSSRHEVTTLVNDFDLVGRFTEPQ